MTPVEFGLFDWVDRSTTTLPELYEQRLQLLEAGDAAGFYCYHLAEHHSTPLGMAPSPGLFLAAAAQRTTRIRLGTLVYLLPLYNPLRLLDEICMLDQLSRGRLDLGIGRGVAPHELRYYGVDPANARAIFDETLAALRSGFTQNRLTFEGKHFQCHDVPIELHPFQKPYPPLWYPTHNPESLQFAARHGFNFVGLGPATAVGGLIDAYRQTWKSHRQDEGRLNGHVADPKLGILRLVVVAETDEEALKITRSAHGDWYHSITKLWHENDDHSVDGLFSWEASMQHETIIFGTPARIREKIGEVIEATGCNYVICAFAWGTLPHEQTMRSMRLFTKEVMPAFAGT
jgi:alkanesulfonate monooxygenase SsuD/methylene tetrahydromethanopterin reductase-like flavin-dependent oxidoreductase (luciferase family)